MKWCVSVHWLAEADRNVHTPIETHIFSHSSLSLFHLFSLSCCLSPSSSRSLPPVKLCLSIPLSFSLFLSLSLSLRFSLHLPLPLSSSKETVTMWACVLGHGAKLRYWLAWWAALCLLLPHSPCNPSVLAANTTHNVRTTGALDRGPTVATYYIRAQAGPCLHSLTRIQTQTHMHTKVEAHTMEINACQHRHKLI